MKTSPLTNSLVTAGSVIALVGATLYAFTDLRDNVPAQSNSPAQSEVIQSSPDKVPSVDALIVGLETRLAAAPEDAKGWILLARSHDHLGNDDEAWRAYARARELGMTDDSLEIKLAANLVGKLQK